MSVDDDIDTWKDILTGYKSKMYNNVYFKFNKNELKIYIKKTFTKEYVIISKYKFWFIPTNIKVNEIKKTLF